MDRRDNKRLCNDMFQGCEVDKETDKETGNQKGGAAVVGRTPGPPGLLYSRHQAASGCNVQAGPGSQPISGPVTCKLLPKSNPSTFLDEIGGLSARVGEGQRFPQVPVEKTVLYALLAPVRASSSSASRSILRNRNMHETTRPTVRTHRGGLEASTYKGKR